MNRVLWVCCVGLTPDLVDDRTPTLSSIRNEGGLRPLTPPLPAVTCTSQSSLLTGGLPSQHGVVGNGWYFRDLAEVWFWRQSNRLVQGKKIWHEARERNSGFTVCNMFWWYNMYADVDWSLTPRPLYFADGRKLPGVYGSPYGFRKSIEQEFSTFPLFQFWGPGAGIQSTQWILDATRFAMRTVDPHLMLVYLPHLDYDFQRYGPDAQVSRQQVEVLDAAMTPLVEDARRQGRSIVITSEYGITEVTSPVHINRALREAGFLETVPLLHMENLDAGASRAFAVADHQIAHVYVRDVKDIPRVRRVLEALDGVDTVLGAEEKIRAGLDHPRSGELVAVAEKKRWFSYYFWLDDSRAPDYAPTVDIHRKPGYDPAELFLDPAKRFMPVRIAGKVLAKKLKFRTLFDVVPIHGDLVRGSHGRLPDTPGEGPVLIADSPLPPGDEPMPMTSVKDWVLKLLFAEG
ncbi:MAG TPA: alkaline phosphatase family protein [Planctomycetes bacterium]|nr:alkaline phosphatase family protein [Planctomycetota bacterium]